jgi:hypothetical protein
LILRNVPDNGNPFDNGHPFDNDGYIYNGDSFDNGNPSITRDTSVIVHYVIHLIMRDKSDREDPFDNSTVCDPFYN